MGNGEEENGEKELGLIVKISVSLREIYLWPQ